MVEGEGLVCGGDKNSPPTRPNVLVQTGFPKEKTTVLEVDPDDPYETYDVARKVISEYEGHQVFADYTGGTKSMTAGLFLAATEFDYCQPILVKGGRDNLIKVTGNRSRLTPIKGNIALIGRYKKMFEELLFQQDYGGARQIVRYISKLGADETDEKFLDRANVAMHAFDLWDRFNYMGAWGELDFFVNLYNPIQPMIEYKITAERLAGLVVWLKAGSSHKRDSGDEMKMFGPPYTVHDPYRETPLPVYDLIRNAERRARMEQYDDAVARLYRATELYAQFALRRRGIHTSNITEETLANLPQEHRERLELKRNSEGRLAIGLFESYELLIALNEPIGKVWEKHKAKIMDAIQFRNFSWLAHGFEPIGKEEYNRFHGVLTEFIQECDETDPHYRKSRRTLTNYRDLPNDVCFMD